MNKMKLNKVIGDGNIVIPLYILKFYKKLNLTMDEFIFLMYLYNKQDNLDFNPEKISLDLNLDIMEVMGYVSVLVDKGYMSLDLKKSETDVLEEVINLANFYEKISMFLINQEEDLKKEDNVYSYIEEKLARSLSSVEVETIKGWQDNKIDISLIKEALKIAINDGVYSLKYIDNILFNWHKNGIRDIVALKQELENKEMPKQEVESEIDTEVFDWNWLDDEEECIIN